MDDVLQRFARPVGEWFRRALGRPTKVQEHGFRVLHEGKSALLLAPTGSGKTLAAFLASLDRLMFGAPAGHPGVRVLYVSPLKALGVDVERNLRVPLTGIAEAAARLGMASSVPSVALRSGDTPAVERARFRRQPSDILITTPESLYLLLTSDAARHLAAVETVIIDEIHALVGTKRGAHLALSLERLERLRSGRPPLVRVGLSATVRPVAEAAAFLGGATPGPNGPVLRPIEIVDATASPRLELSIRVPEGEFRAPTADAVERSLWPAIHAPLVELVREHRSTLVFVNSRRLAERLAAALNDLAGEPLVLAHHGSLAREKRLEIEEALKRGELRGLVATSSLELGIDMGAIDLVIQVEAPPSIASGLQRVGRAGHTVAGTSRGLVFPKFRGDLLACAAAADGMRRGAVEAVHYPRNPLDVLAQQIVAIASGGPIGEDELYALVRSAAPFTELDRAAFDSVLDLLSGRYASDAFAELKPRIVWDRVGRTIAARTGARHIAIVNGGTIPDRGLFGVYLAASDGGKTVRVGELDEEMVFESRPGDVVLLGASSFRIEEITFDRVLVTPAPGEPGRMPFWRGDRAGRSLELGRALGRLTRELVELSGDEARARLAEIGAEERAGRALLEYLAEQRAATGDVPSDRTVVIEHFVDEMGDIRVCLLSPFGARVHAPWALAAMELQRTVLGVETEAIWSDDGIVFRFPEGHRPEDLSLLVPDADDLEGLLLRSLAQSSLFAARFRENAARALLLPRRRPGQRTPLWAQRRRAADLLRAASAHPDFPILLETYRECLRDVFDVPGLTELLEAVARREVRVALVGTRSPSPFAAALLFSYVGNFIYAGDVPLAERRAQLLTLDPVQLRRLLGATEQRTLLDPESIAEVEHDVGRRAKRVAHADQLHDLLIAVGDLTLEEAASRLAEPAALEGFVAELVRAKRVLRLEIAGERRLVAVEDAARYRDALGVALPAGLPRALLASVAEPLRDLVSRYARTHGPFAAAAVARRFGIGTAPALTELRALVAAGRLVSGEFLPGGTELEFCEVEVLRRIKQKSLSRLRREIEPSPMRAYARLVIEWQGAARPELGHDALASALARLEGAPLVASALEQSILPARVLHYQTADLDALTSSGEFVFRGLDALGTNDGRLAFYRAERYALLAPPVTPVSGELAEKIRSALRQNGASFFFEILARVQAFPRDVLETLWAMVWAGEVTNDTLAPLRSRFAEAQERERRRGAAPRVRPHLLPGSEGRWSRLERFVFSTPSATERLAAAAAVLLDRYGIVTRETAAADALATFSELYPVYQALEEAGRVRRGYFVSELAAAQFARPGAEERLRRLRERELDAEPITLAATDPANPYGAVLPWPEREPRPQRAAGALVILWDGLLIGHLGRNEQTLLTFIPDDERARAESVLARALVRLVEGSSRRALVIARIDGLPATQSPLGPALERAGFVATADGFVFRHGSGRSLEAEPSQA